MISYEVVEKIMKFSKIYFFFSVEWSKNPIFNHKFLGCFWVKNGFFGKIALEAKKRRPNYDILDMLEIWSLFTYPYRYLADIGRFEQFSHQHFFFLSKNRKKSIFPKIAQKCDRCSKLVPNHFLGPGKVISSHISSFFVI